MGWMCPKCNKELAPKKREWAKPGNEFYCAAGCFSDRTYTNKDGETKNYKISEADCEGQQGPSGPPRSTQTTPASVGTPAANNVRQNGSMGQGFNGAGYGGIGHDIAAIVAALIEKEIVDTPASAFEMYQHYKNMMYDEADRKQNGGPTAENVPF